MNPDDTREDLAHQLAELEERQPDIDRYRSALASPVWADTIYPLIQERKIKAVDRLVTLCVQGAEDAKIRSQGTEVAALNWVTLVLQSRIQEHEEARKRVLEALAQLDELDARDRSVVDLGRGNPYRQVVDPTDWSDDE
jgi:hypothetical protein